MSIAFLLIFAHLFLSRFSSFSTVWTTFMSSSFSRVLVRAISYSCSFSFLSRFFGWRVFSSRNGRKSAIPHDMILTSTSETSFYILPILAFVRAVTFLQTYTGILSIWTWTFFPFFFMFLLTFLLMRIMLLFTFWLFLLLLWFSFVFTPFSLFERNFRM